MYGKGVIQKECIVMFVCNVQDVIMCVLCICTRVVVSKYTRWS